MSNKILNLKLIYKGKVLDIAKQKRDFTDKFLIGSDKDIFWQILDRSFPEKYILLSKNGESYQLHVRQGMTLSVQKSGEVLDEAALRRQNLLTDSKLQLQEGLQGTVRFSTSWEISFEYVVPYVPQLSAEQRQIIKQYARRTELTEEERFTRNFMIIAVFLTFVCMFAFDKLYNPIIMENTLSSRLKASQEVATKVEIDESMKEEAQVAEAVETGSEEAEKQEQKEQKEPEQAKTTQATSSTVSSTGSRGNTAAASILGFNPGSTQAPKQGIRAKVVSMTVDEQIVATGPGGGGRGTGTGGSAGGGGGGTTAARGGSAFNTAPVNKRNVDVGTLFQGNPNLARSSGMKEIDASALGGSTGKIQAVRIYSSPQLSSVRRSFSSAGIAAVKESELAVAAPEVKASYADIKRYVAINKPQLQNLFLEESRLQSMYGAMEVTLYISESGRVEAVQINPKSGSSFTASFLQKADQLMRSWRIPVSKKAVYTFSSQFFKN